VGTELGICHLQITFCKSYKQKVDRWYKHKFSGSLAVLQSEFLGTELGICHLQIIFCKSYKQKVDRWHKHKFSGFAQKGLFRLFYKGQTCGLFRLFYKGQACGCRSVSALADSESLWMPLPKLMVVGVWICVDSGMPKVM
jgi:hypothetical protein